MTTQWSRRALLGAGGSLLGGAVASGLLPENLWATSSHFQRDPFIAYDATELAAMIRRKEVSAPELTEVTIARIKRLNPLLNAVVTPDFKNALTRAKSKLPDGPFTGVPYLVKDLADFAGVRTTQGSRLMQGNIAKETGVYVKQALASGFNMLGKTNSPEFGILPTTEPILFGPTANPWDLHRSPGGSSGGAAAAVASGMVPLAQGSDGGGSIRIPASCCGLFGLKVSRRRNVWPGHLSVRGFDVKGHLSRSVRDTAMMLAITEAHGKDSVFPPVGMVTEPAKKRLRIGLVTEGMTGKQPDTDVNDAVMDTAKLCQLLGHEVEAFTLPVDGTEFNRQFMFIMCEGVGKLAFNLEKNMGHWPTADILEPWTLFLAEYYKKHGQEAVEKAAQYFEKLTVTMENVFNKFDVLLSPVLASAPVKTGALGPLVDPDVLMPTALDYIAYTPLYNSTGQPAMSVPLGWNKQNLPIGSQFAAGLGKEKLLLELAYELEKARPWKNRWAPHSAFYQ